MGAQRHRLAVLLFTAALGLQGCPGAAAADNALAPPAAEPQAQPLPEPLAHPPQQPLPQPERLQLPQGWLSGQQLLGLPDWLALSLSWTAAPFVNPTGGERQLGNWMQQSSLSLTMGSGLAKAEREWREVDHWSVAINLNHYSGDPSYASEIGALFPLQQIAYPSGPLLTELSLTRSAGGGWLELKGGIVPLNPPFITAPIFNSYVHSAFNNTLNLSLVNSLTLTPYNLPINPYAALGGIATIQPRPNLNLRYGWFDLRSTAGLAGWLGGPALPPPSALGSAQMLQLDWSPPSLAPASGATLPACRRGAALTRRKPNCPQPVQVDNQLPGGLFSLGGLNGSSEGRGAYGSLTLRSGLPLGLDDRVWIGGSWGSDGQSSVNVSFLGAGLLIQGIVPRRPLDLLVLGAGRAAGLGTGDEGMVELGYQWQINRNLALQPTLQWIIHPSGASPTPPGILAAGLQISLTF